MAIFPAPELAFLVQFGLELQLASRGSAVVD
jgi:hypothetical protein